VSVLLITLPIFLLIALGVVLRLTRTLTKESIQALNGFVFWVALPAVILISFWGIDWTDATTQRMLLLNTGFLAGFALLLGIAVRVLPVAGATRGALFTTILVGNTVYMGFPLGERALGEANFDLFLAAATPHLVIGVAFSILAIELFTLGSHSVKRYVKDFALNPLILALVAGIGLSLSGVSGTAVDLLKQTIGMLAATASPVALVTLGAFLTGAFHVKLLPFAMIAALGKLALLPWAIITAGTVVGVEPALLTASALAAAMPTAVTSFVIAQKYRANPELVAAALFVSTLASVATIPLLLVNL
jgi:predicted permease